MNPKLDGKILNTEQLELQSKIWHKAGKTIVFTNGCFDLLHEGHVRYLAEAKALGDYLIVGLNDDKSVRRLKGPTRPINLQYSRAIVLSAIESVDAVVIFEEDTPIELINLCKPNILVKGGDWKTDQMVGANEVIDNGGQVFSLQFHNGFSTSIIEQKMKST